MRHRPPLIAILLGAAGLIPFLVCGLVSVGPAGADADRALQALITYAAVILAFLGAVHWGVALADPEPDDGPAAPAGMPTAARTMRARYGLGVVPALIGWGACLLTLALSSWWGLVTLVAGYAATIAAETRAGRLGLVSSGYLWLRWPLTVVAVAILITVLTLQTFGAHIS